MHRFKVSGVVNYRSHGCSGRTNEDILEGPMMFRHPNPQVLYSHLVREIHKHYKDLLIDFELKVKRADE